MLTLARRPDIARRLATGSEEYVEAFAKELLRSYPPTWLMGREVWRHTTVGDVEVHPGEQVMFCAYLVHRDRRWWDRPEVFNPERWLTGSAPHAQYAYFPFGAGPRLCTGNHVGWRQLLVAVRILAREYDVTVADPEPPTVAHALLVPGGLRAQFIPRAMRNEAEQASWHGSGSTRRASVNASVSRG